MNAGTLATRRHLPHLENAGKTYFVTFSTRQRSELTPEARDLVLETIVRDHRYAYWLHCAVVMPDHVHLVATPYDDWRISAVLQRVKSVSSHRVNRLFGRRGALWQDESFDRILRRDEDIRKKSEYVVQNPVRAGFTNYSWVWREWVEGSGTGEGACPPLDDTDYTARP